MDVTEEGVMKSFAMVEAGELARPERCKRVWLGSTDLEREVASSLLATIHPIIPQGVWRDSETNEVLDISALWGPGQPNGVRIQNCAGIWETVRVEGLASLARTGRGRSGWMMAPVTRKGSAGTIFHGTYTLFSLCTFPLPPRTTLRGLCPTALVDTSYTLRWDAQDNLPYFRGFLSTVIRFPTSCQFKYFHDRCQVR